MIRKYANLSLLPYNTFGIDVRANTFVEYTSVDDLKALLAGQDTLPKPFFSIGGGSNLLFAADFEGTVFHSAIKGMEVVDETDSEVYVRVGAGEVWDDFVACAVRNNWYGAENLSLIPGEVGASAVQNIGAYGVEAKDLIYRVETVEVATGCDRSFMQADCGFAYRQSLFKTTLKGKYIVTYVTYRLSKQEHYNLEYGNLRSEMEGEQIGLQSVRNAIIRIRQSKLPDPKVLGNGGSFFMNPVIGRSHYESLIAQYPDMPHYEVGADLVKVPAAWLIDRCGWKGRTLGRAGVHDKQALVLVNRGGATGLEIMELSRAIQASVSEKFGIAIQPEVNVIGG